MYALPDPVLAIAAALRPISQDRRQHTVQSRKHSFSPVLTLIIVPRFDDPNARYSINSEPCRRDTRYVILPTFWNSVVTREKCLVLPMACEGCTKHSLLLSRSLTLSSHPHASLRNPLLQVSLMAAS